MLIMTAISTYTVTSLVGRCVIVEENGPTTPITIHTFKDDVEAGHQFFSYCFANKMEVISKQEHLVRYWNLMLLAGEEP